MAPGVGETQADESDSFRMTFMLPSDDRNTYRDFRLPFLERLRMVAEALPDDQRPLVDRAVIELTAMQPPAASTVKLLAGPAVQEAIREAASAPIKTPKPAPKPKKKSGDYSLEWTSKTCYIC